MNPTNEMPWLDPTWLELRIHMYYRLVATLYSVAVCSVFVPAALALDGGTLASTRTTAGVPLRSFQSATIQPETA